MYNSTPSRSLFYSSASWCICTTLIIYIMVLYQTKTHSFIRSWNVELLSFFPLKKSQGSATPGCTLTHSKAKPSKTGPEKYPLYSTQEGHPSWFLLVPCDWWIWASPPETDQDSCSGWLPLVSLNLVFPPPQEGFSPGPLTPIVKCFPATRILPITFVCFLCTTANWKAY